MSSSLEVEFDAVEVSAPPRAAPAAQHLVWDLPVRLMHWSLVLAFAGAYLTHRLGVSYFKYHVWSGYAVLLLVTLRILWGLVGTYHARFASFVRGPRTVLRYTRALLRGGSGAYAGHNPLGAWMVLLLLAGLLLQAAMGLFGNDEIMNVGPLAGWVSNALSVKLTSWHRQLFYGLAVAVLLHVLAVLAHLLLKREPLLRAMLTGRKPAAQVPATQAIASSRLWLALSLFVLLAGTLALIVAQAPGAESSLY